MGIDVHASFLTIATTYSSWIARHVAKVPQAESPCDDRKVRAASRVVVTVCLWPALEGVIPISSHTLFA